ncbi:hypothetical protein BMF94_3964 [Rhodotorula taiwanensis]|uniref:F-box domain-containing protein n=1 Tax=Rhodotorula taiwanensis TaxID=741276 RepID=A0A2S5B873_9BASI|nr:hypothetical protein BMF94_3964 [Rhodotorula taiwanensis]
MASTVLAVPDSLATEPVMLTTVEQPDRLDSLLQDARAWQQELKDDDADDDDDLEEEATTTAADRTDYAAADLLPPEVVEMILHPQFEGCTNFKDKLRAMARLASVCRAWKAVAEAAAFASLHLHANADDMLARLAAPEGLLKYLPLVQTVDLVENRDLGALYERFVGILRNARLGDTATGEPTAPTRKQVKAMATILAECEGLLALNAREYADSVMQLLVTRFRFAELWPRLRSIRISWQFPLSAFYQMLVQISHIDTLESVYLYVVPKSRDSEPDALARSQKLFGRVQRLPRLQHFGVETYAEVPLFCDIVFQLVSPRAHLSTLTCRGSIPPGWCEKVVQHCIEIDVLAFSWMRAGADLRTTLLPQIPMLGAIRIRKLTLTVRPMWALVDPGERMPSVIALLNSLPPAIETVDALTVLGGRVTAFARDYRLNVIVRRPVIKAYKRNQAGRPLANSTGRLLKQIVYVHAEGLAPPYTALGRFCKTDDVDGELGEWHRADTGETLDLANRPAEELTPESLTGAMWA